MTFLRVCLLLFFFFFFFFFEGVLLFLFVSVLLFFLFFFWRVKEIGGRGGVGGGACRSGLVHDHHTKSEDSTIIVNKYTIGVTFDNN